MQKPIKLIYTILHFVIAFIWLINGLYCKVLDFVPRHKQIVGEILGTNYAHTLTKMIGFGEIFLFVWILSRLYTRFCAILQIVLVLTMNVIEFIVASDLLLFGKLNIFIAIIFATIIYWHEFILKKSLQNT
jgi:DoxX-like family